MAANYGWLMPGSQWAGIRLGPSVSIPGVGGIQAPPGTRHGFLEADYSQVARLVARHGATLDGEPIEDLAEVLADPNLAPLLSHEGVTIARQPGVAPLKPLNGFSVVKGKEPEPVTPGAPPQPPAVSTLPARRPSAAPVALALALGVVAILRIRR
jgi:hypothetical protein